MPSLWPEDDLLEARRRRMRQRGWRPRGRTTRGEPLWFLPELGASLGEPDALERLRRLEILELDRED